MGIEKLHQSQNRQTLNVDDTSLMSRGDAIHLPLEILSQIFLKCVPLRDNPFIKSSQSAITRSKFEIRWTLRKVSYYWKSVAESTPELWSFIDISNFCLQRSERWDLLQMCFDWSNIAPLSINLGDLNLNTQDVPPFVLNFVFANAHRWKHVDGLLLDAHTGPRLLQLHTDPIHRFSLLESIGVKVRGGTSGRDLIDLSNMFASCRLRLKDVSMNMMGQILPPTFFRMEWPWGDLLRLDFGNMLCELDLRTLLGVLGKCTRLKVLKICYRSLSGLWYKPVERVELRALRIFVINGTQSEYLLGNMRFPVQAMPSIFPPPRTYWDRGQ